MAISEVLYSSRSEEYGTPWELFKEWDEEFEFTLDPCATKGNTKVPSNYFTKEQDGLAQDWGTHRVFMNPPYGKEIRKWMHKARISSLQGATVICLVHARTDTRWWQEEVENSAAFIDFVRGRVKFEGAKYSSPFPSVIVGYLPNDSLWLPNNCWVRA